MISTSSFITLCLVVMYIVAFFLSFATIEFFIGDKAFNLNALQRFGYVILALILAPFLWSYGIALIIDYIFRKIKESEN